jgi:alpha-glucosidase
MVWNDATNSGFTTGTPWLPVKEPQAARHAAGQVGPDSVLSHYRRMIALRKKRASLRTGRTEFLDLDSRVLAFRRGEEILCLFNLSQQPVDLLGGTRQMTQELGRGCKITSGRLSLDGLGFVILRDPKGTGLLATEVVI